MFGFRRARPASFARNAAKTLAQIIVMWTSALALAPALIVAVERHWVPLLALTPRPTLGFVLFGLFSLGGLASAWTLVRAGEGTPLPFDTTRRLVCTGTHAHVRNPMAVTGVGQGLAVGVVLGSPSVVLYALTGAWLWNFGVRPFEERDLLAQFGPAYARYRAAVPCWVPRLTPYQECSPAGE